MQSIHYPSPPLRIDFAKEFSSVLVIENISLVLSIDLISTALIKLII
jgi:hypothetical protein